MNINKFHSHDDVSRTFNLVLVWMSSTAKYQNSAASVRADNIAALT